MKHRTMRVDNLACVGCGEHISAELLKINGIRDVKVNHITRSVEVVYDLLLVELKDIESALEKLGYPLHESKVNRLKTGFLHFTEENERSNIQAAPRPCCSLSPQEKEHTSVK